MDVSSSGDASSVAASKLRLLDLPAEDLSHIISYIPRKSLFSMLVVSHRFHQLASAALYRNLTFQLAHSDMVGRSKDTSLRLADALHTILTSSYDYAQHVKNFTLRMFESDLDHIQKRIAAKFLATEDAGMLLNTALLVMIRRAKGLEQFNWQVPIECNGYIYQALSNVASLQTLHIHLDVYSVSKTNYNIYPPPPPPQGPVFGAGQPGVWWDNPMATSSSLPPLPGSSIGSVSKPSKSSATKSKLQSRKLGAIKGLQSLAVTAIDDLSCLEEIAACLQASSGSLKTLKLSFAESLVSKSQKPNPNAAHNAIHIQEDDATTEPGSPDLNATASGPTELDLKREKQAQDQALARIFGLDKASAGVQKQLKKVEKSLKHSAKSTRLSKSDTKSLDGLTLQVLSAVQSSKLEPDVKNQLENLLEAIIPTLSNHGQKWSDKKHKASSSSKKDKWSGGSGSSSVPSAKFGQPSNDFWGGDGSIHSNTGSTKPLPDFSGSLDGFEFGTNITPAAVPSSTLAWDSNTSSLALSSNPPKTSFPFGDSASFQLNTSKNHILPAHTLSSQNGFLPNIHPSYVHTAVSHNIPSYGINAQKFGQWLNYVKILLAMYKTAGVVIGTPLIDKILADLPSSLYQQGKASILQALQANILNQQNQNTLPTKKKKPIPATITPNDSSSDSSSDSDSESGSSTVLAPANQNGNVDALDGIMSDFDMEHPDVVDSDGEGELEGNDEEQTDNQPASSQVTDHPEGDKSADDKGKGKQMADPKIPSITTADTPDNDSNLHDSIEIAKVQTVEESIQEYVRMAHGLSIQDLTLSFIPLKSSILVKALDLTTLRRIVFFNVGAQGAFWTMVEKLVDQGTVFNLQTIYTDDVSTAFVTCLGKLSGLKCLHLLRRSSKEFSCTSSKPPATLTDIHKIGLSKHFETLQSLSITNLEDDSWDVDDKLVRALSYKAKKLKELAFSIDSNYFHVFLRSLPGLKNLVAIHLINIRISGAPSPMMPHNEWKKLLLDVLCYYPSLKLKYVGIALVNQGRVSQIGEKPKMSISSWYKKQDEQQQGGAGGSSKTSKGKGKAIVKEASSQVPSSSASKTSYDSSDPDDERPNVFYAKTYRTSALADSYSIYSNLVLKGRL